MRVMNEVKKHDTLADFTIRMIGTMEGLFFIAQKQGISITSEVAAGTEIPVTKDDVLFFRTIKKAKVVVPEIVKSEDFSVLMKHQNNSDFICQHTGSLENIFAMARLNGISITKKPVAGELLKVMNADNRIVAGFRASGLIIASEDDRPGDVRPGGIGYMQIQNNFIVS